MVASTTKFPPLRIEPMKSFAELLDEQEKSLNFYLDVCSDPNSSEEDIVTAREHMIALTDERDRIEMEHYMMQMGGE
jgi:hypothetical protein